MYSKLRTLRRINEYSLDDIAEMSGVSPSYISLIERGKIKEIKNGVKRRSIERVIKRLQKIADRKLSRR